MEEIMAVGKFYGRYLKWSHRKDCRGYERVYGGHSYGEKMSPAK